MKLNLINQKKFNKLSTLEKRVAICRDVLDRLKFNYLKPFHGALVNNPYEFIQEETTIKQMLNSREGETCEACAKGALVCSWIGNFNKVEEDQFLQIADTDNGMKYAPEELKEIFGATFLDNLEAAFEGQAYYWHANKTLAKQYAKAFAVTKSPSGSFCKEGSLPALMLYIIECGGEFPLPSDTSYPV